MNYVGRMVGAVESPGRDLGDESPEARSATKKDGQ